MYFQWSIIDISTNIIVKYTYLGINMLLLNDYAAGVENIFLINLNILSLAALSWTGM
jgi:hypothetical protein